MERRRRGTSGHVCGILALHISRGRVVACHYGSVTALGQAATHLGRPLPHNLKGSQIQTKVTSMLCSYLHVACAATVARLRCMCSTTWCRQQQVSACTPE